MELEEAALRAKIQAVKNLLEATTRSGTSHSANHRSHEATAPSARPYAPYYARKPSLPVNKTWTRAPAATSTSTNPAAGGSSNRVWVNTNAVCAPAKAPAAAPAPAHSPPMSFTKRVRNRMQLQMLRLNDGEYAKANGGFSLVRSDVMKAKAAAVAKTATTRTSVHLTATAAVARKPTFSNPSTASTAARAQAAVHRARLTTARTKVKARMRTEYCRFFNKFGKLSTKSYCNNKNSCKFLHDSRRVALCRKFVRGACTDADCLLSHDKNKMPVCVMFLRGACTRDDCRFRHVKVSGSAQICEAFVSGHCPQGAACPMKHELPIASKKRALSMTTSSTASAKQQKLESSYVASGTLDSSGSNVEAPPPSLSSVGAATVPSAPLSIRPNIRFAPRQSSGGLLSLLPPRKRQTQSATKSS